MNNQLTTGQVIDRLKVEEVAVNQSGFKLKYGQKGDLLLFEGDEEPGGEDKFTLYYPFVENDRWSIIPKYVEFEEAMEGLKDGKVVTLHIRDVEHSFSQENYFQTFVDKGITISDFCNGKYTVED